MLRPGSRCAPCWSAAGRPPTPRLTRLTRQTQQIQQIQRPSPSGRAPAMRHPWLRCWRHSRGPGCSWCPAGAMTWRRSPRGSPPTTSTAASWGAGCRSWSPRGSSPPTRRAIPLPGRLWTGSASRSAGTGSKSWRTESATAPCSSPTSDMRRRPCWANCAARSTPSISSSPRATPRTPVPSMGRTGSARRSTPRSPRLWWGSSHPAGTVRCGSSRWARVSARPRRTSSGVCRAT